MKYFLIILFFFQSVFAYENSKIDMGKFYINKYEITILEFKSYADKNKFNYVLIYGKEEAEEKVIKIKNLKTGDENKHKLDDSIKNYKF